MCRVMAVCLVGFFSVCVPSAQAVTLKIATLAPDGTQWMKEMRSGAEEIKARTGGRVVVPPHHEVSGAIGASLLAREEMAKQTQNGTAPETRK